MCLVKWLSTFWINLLHVSPYLPLKWKQEVLCEYRCAPISAGNMYQHLLQLRETVDNTERYTQRGIRVSNINTVKFIDK
jgi:hypothetical protein